MLKRIKTLTPGWIRTGVATLGLFALLTGATKAAEPAATEPVKARPSVLLLADGPSRIDFSVLKAFVRRGFEMDYADGRTWARELQNKTLPNLLNKYNVVVMIQACESQGNVNQAALLQTLADYASAGGGLLLMPNTITWDIPAIYDDFAKESLKIFGARFAPSTWILEQDPANQVQAGVAPVSHFAWTDNVVSHPVTAGVKGVWYLLDTYRNGRCTTLPVELEDPAWTVVLKAGKTAKTMTHAEYFVLKNMSPTNIGAAGLVAAKKWDSEPPLMAVRTLGKGRAAYLPMDDLTIWCAGYRYVHGADLAETGPGLQLGGTAKSRTSDLEKLLDNTFRWLAEPALAAGGKPGGYVQDPAKLDEVKPAPQPPLDWAQLEYGKDINLEEVKKIASYHGMTDQWEFWYRTLQLKAKPYKGLLGARSTLSDGKAAPEEMIKAARDAGLDFLVFLERFDLLTPEKWEILKAACAKATDENFCVLPGFTIESNRNHSLFLFGAKLAWPGKNFLTTDGKQVNFAAEEKHSGLTEWIDMMVSKIQNSGNQMGYYWFTGPAPAGQVRPPMYDLRLYSAVGLYYYDGSKLVEGPQQNWEAFKDVNDTHLCIQPYAIDLVYDPAQLQTAVREHALTRVIAEGGKDIPAVLAYGYRGRESCVSTAPAAGPVVHVWTCQNRDYSTLPLRRWVTPNYRWRVDCAVSAEAGLDTVELWDGVDLFRRIKLNGAKQFTHNFDLGHDQQRQLMLKVTDRQGNVSISGNVQNGDHTSQDYFCSDRINGSLFHGPYGAPGLSYGLQKGRLFECKGYDGWEGREVIPATHCYSRPWQPGFSETKTQGFGGAHCFNLLSAQDGRSQSTTSDYAYPVGEKIIHAWYTYGPLLEREFTGTTGWVYEQSGDLKLYETFVTFKTDGKIESWPGPFVSDRTMGGLPGNRAQFACAAGPREPIYVFNLPEQTEELWRLADSDFRIRKGGFFAFCGTAAGSGAMNAYVMDDYPRRLVKSEKNRDSYISLEVLPAGTEYKKGERKTARILCVTTPVSDAIGPWWYQRTADWLGLDGSPDIKLTLKAGKRLPVTDGFCDLDIGPAGYADMTFAPDSKAPLKTLGVRLKGGNSRWTVMQYRPVLPFIKSLPSFFLRYVVEVKREVEDGLKPSCSYHDTGYVAVDLPQRSDDPLQLLAGHPVIASDRRVFITVTALSWKPYTYRVEANNPTDETLSVTFKPGLPLPDFPFKEQKMTLAPGEIKDLTTK